VAVDDCDCIICMYFLSKTTVSNDKESFIPILLALKFLIMASPSDNVGEAIMIVGCPIVPFDYLFIHLSICSVRYCYHDIS